MFKLKHAEVLWTKRVVPVWQWIISIAYVCRLGTKSRPHLLPPPQASLQNYLKFIIAPAGYWGQYIGVPTYIRV